MRLTLRTLLAYLDDTLEPSQAKLIGQKVAESEIARQLSERIKQITRRRRLSVPPATGPGAKIDPNTVAEYLDNVLPAEKLAEVEEICLNSDVHLAEIAACHQILTLVLGEPTRVPPTAKQRMYTLVKGRESIPYRKAMATPSRELPAVRLKKTKVEEQDEALLMGLPAYGRQGTWFRLLAPLVGVCALVLGLVVVVILAMPSGPSRRSGIVAGLDKTPTSKEKTDRDAVEKTDKDKDKDKDAADKRITDKDGKDKPVTDKGETKPTTDKPVDKPIIEEPGPPAKPSTDRKEVARYAKAESNLTSVLVQRGAKPGQWQRLTAEKDRIATNEYLVSLPGYRSELRLDNGLALTMWGNLPELSDIPVLECALMLHVPPQGFDLDLTLSNGRIVLVNNKKDGDAQVRVRFFSEIWDLTLENKAEAAVELWGRFPPGVPFLKQAGGDGPLMMAALFCKGQVQFRNVNRYSEWRMPNPGLFVWDSYRSSALTEPFLIADLPPWWLGKNSGTSAQVSEIRVALDELNMKLKKDAAPDVVLTQERQKGNKEIPRMLAVVCQAALDDVPSVVDALTDTRKETRSAAILALRHWISKNPENDLNLYKVLCSPEGPSKGYTEGEAEYVMQLLHGFSDHDKALPQTYEVLIAWLLHDKIAIRELAHWHLARMVPSINKTIKYDAAGEAGQREAAYKTWKERIPDGKLPPK